MDNLCMMKKLLFYIIFLFAIPEIQAQEQLSVFFESNKFALDTKQTKSLSQWIEQNTTSKIVAIHGFTDEDGTTGFNDTLARKRVDHVFDFVKDKIKIRDDFKTLSFGENHPLLANKSENRKVIIYFIEEKDIAREDEILGIKKEIPVETPRPEIKFPEKITVQNPNGTQSEYRLNVAFMKSMSLANAGEKLIIENLNFQINTFAIVSESRPKLYELLLVLQNNPKMKINIQGHLCCMPTDKTNLSTQRAKAIYGFLVASDISKDRLSYQGFGSTKAIYPLPEKNEAERAANRRVEIEIIEN